MGSQDKDLSLKVTADTSSAVDNLKKFTSTVTGQVAIWSAAINQIAGTVTSIIDSIKRPLLDVAHTGEELNKFSQQLGITVESLDKMKKVAGITETSLDDVASGVKKFAKELHTTNDTSSFAAAIKTIGLNLDELKGMSPDEALIKISQAFTGLKDGSGKTALAMTLFGKSGAALIPFLNELNEKFGKMESYWTAEKAKQADEFSDSLKRMEANSKKLATTLGQFLIPKLNNLFDYIYAPEKAANRNLLDDIEYQIKHREAGLKSGIFFSPADKKKSEDELALLKVRREVLLKAMAPPEEPKKKDVVLPDLAKQEAHKTALDTLTEAVRKYREGVSATNPALTEFEKDLVNIDNAYQSLVAQIEKNKELSKKEKEDLKFKAETGKMAAENFSERKRQLDEEEKEKQILAENGAARKAAYRDMQTAEAERLKSHEALIQGTIDKENELQLIKTRNAQGSEAESLQALEQERARIEALYQERELLYFGDAEALKLAGDEKKAALELLAEKERQINERINPSESFKAGLRDIELEYKNTGKQMGELSRGIAGEMSQGFSDGFFDAMQWKFKSLGEYIKSFVTNVQRQIANIAGQQVTGSLISGAKSLFGFESGGIMTQWGPLQLRRYEGGGVAYSPQLALFGEGKKPEAYVPLPDGRRIPAVVDFKGAGASGSGGGAVIHEHYYYINAVDAKSFSDLVERNPGAIVKAVSDNKRDRGVLR